MATLPNTCPKCGSDRWSLPKYDGLSDTLMYICGGCRYISHVTPLDRR